MRKLLMALFDVTPTTVPPPVTTARISRQYSNARVLEIANRKTWTR